MSFLGYLLPQCHHVKKKQRTGTSDPMTHPWGEMYIYLLIYLITSTIHVGTPWKINVEPENGDLEDWKMILSCSIWWILVTFLGSMLIFRGVPMDGMIQPYQARWTKLPNCRHLHGHVPPSHKMQHLVEASMDGSVSFHHFTKWY